MIWIGAAVARAALVGLKCPHCSEVQARARTGPTLTICCRVCRKTFSHAQGELQYRKWKRSSVGNR